MEKIAKPLLTLLGAFTAMYSVAVLGYVVSTPDVRLRCVVLDQANRHPDVEGLPIQSDLGIQYKGSSAPRPGDLLVRMNDQPIETFMDFTRGMNRLRGELPDGGWIYSPEDLVESAAAEGLPPLVEELETGRRFVEVAFVPREKLDRTDLSSDQKVETAWLVVQPLPLGDVLLSLLLFLLHLAALVLAAVAFWKRPFERAFRLFFAMAIVSLAAYVGGYHWWVISSNIWLNVPFVICAMLVPVVSLHFFLVYPRPKPMLANHPRLTIAAIYFCPVVGITGALSLLVYVRWLYGRPDAARNVAEILPTLRLLVAWVYAYMAVSAGYFAAMIVTLWQSFVRTRNPMERGPLRWLLGASFVAAGLVGTSLYLAFTSPTDFALGPARVPMFVASLSFLVAYVVGITRYRMMLVDDVVSRGGWYYLVSYSLTVAFCLMVALSTLVPQYMNISLSAQQALTVSGVLMVFVFVLLWIRDRFQQVLDRKFFREKYQLDKALTRMNRAVGHLSDPEAIVRMMLSSCRDVLGVEQAALYLRTSRSEDFQLIASEGGEQIPLEIEGTGELVAMLADGGTVQRVNPDTRSEMSALQRLLRELRAGLIHTLDVEWGLAGLVVLGEKKTGSPFTAEDLTFLHALGQMTNVAFHSAKVDQEITKLNDELRLKIEKIAEQNRQIAILQAELAGDARPASAPAAQPDGFRRDAIRGSSPAISSVLETVRKVATSESSVLIRGESGTGKELLARVIHENSPRAKSSLVAVHCASLSPTLLESELFGHVKGAFTGADRDRIGRFEMANGGTLFLDEIGDISLETQVKLLRVLQERKFEPVGGSRTIEVDVRLVTATHQDLERLIAEGRFREDLYYRLNVISITLPPLRERMEDIYELAFHFLRKSARRTGKRILDFDADALEALKGHRWPGNIRELENAIERAVVLAETDRITLRDLPAETTRPAPLSYAIDAKPPALASPGKNGRIPFESTAGSSERKLLEEALARCGGNKAEAARRLGIPRSTFFSKLKKYSIQ